MPPGRRAACLLVFPLLCLRESIFLDLDPALIVSRNILLHECHASVCLAGPELSRGIYEWFFAHIFHLFEMLGNVLDAGTDPSCWKYRAQLVWLGTEGKSSGLAAQLCLGWC